MKMLSTYCKFAVIISILFISQSYATNSNVDQLVSELKTAVANSEASEHGKTEIEAILNSCSSESSSQAVCACLNDKLPSRAHKLVNRCYALSSN